MKPLYLVTALAISTAVAGCAFDRTTVMQGLSGPTKGAKLKSESVSTQPLEDEGIAVLAGRNLRTRFWAIGGSGGIVPIHGHADRPAVFTVASGDIFEYSSLEDEPIHHMTGGLAKEEGSLAHWWRNAGTETVHLIAFDVQPVAKDYAAVSVSPVPTAVKFDLPAAKAVQNDLLGVVDLGSHFNDAYGTGWALTTYRATIEPGGVLPDFTGPGEPLQTFLWKGELQEHRSDKDETVTLAERTGSNLGNGATAYWENTGDVAAELYFGVVEPLSEVEGVEAVGVLAHGEH